MVSIKSNILFYYKISKILSLACLFNGKDGYESIKTEN